MLPAQLSNRNIVPLIQQLHRTVTAEEKARWTHKDARNIFFM